MSEETPVHDAPHVVRVMKDDGGSPAVGDSSAMLGERPANMVACADDNGISLFGPGSGGISVAGCIRTLLATLLPKRFAAMDPERFRGARANNSQKVWVMGNKPYEEAPVTEALMLRIEQASDPPGHGQIEASSPMPLQEYQNALSATRSAWYHDERHPNDCAVCKKFGLR